MEQLKDLFLQLLVNGLVSYKTRGLVSDEEVKELFQVRLQAWGRFLGVTIPEISLLEFGALYSMNRSILDTTPMARVAPLLASEMSLRS